MRNSSNKSLAIMAILLLATSSFMSIYPSLNMVYATEDKNKAEAINNIENTAENQADSSSTGISSSESSNTNAIENTNTNVNLQNQSSNQTVGENGDGNGQPETCPECFTTYLTDEQIEQVYGETTPEEECAFLQSGNHTQTEAGLRNVLAGVGVSEENIDNLIECLIDNGAIFQD